MTSMSPASIVRLRRRGHVAGCYVPIIPNLRTGSFGRMRRAATASMTVEELCDTLSDKCRTRDWAQADRIKGTIERLLDDDLVALDKKSAAYRVLATYASARRRDADLLEYVTSMERLEQDIPPNCLTDVFRATIALELPEYAVHYMRRMPKMGLEITPDMFTRCAALCGRIGAIDSMLLLFETMSVKGEVARNSVRSPKTRHELGETDPVASRVLWIAIQSALEKRQTEFAVEMLTSPLMKDQTLKRSHRIQHRVFTYLLDDVDGTDRKSPLRAFRFARDCDMVKLSTVGSVMGSCLTWGGSAYNRMAIDIFNEVSALELEVDQNMYAMCIEAHFRVREYDEMLKRYEEMMFVGAEKDGFKLEKRRYAHLLASLQRAVCATRGVSALRKFTDLHATDAPCCLVSAAGVVVHATRGDHTNDALEYIRSFAESGPSCVTALDDVPLSVMRQLRSTAKAILSTSRGKRASSNVVELLSSIVRVVDNIPLTLSKETDNDRRAERKTFMSNRMHEISMCLDTMRDIMANPVERTFEYDVAAHDALNVERVGMFSGARVQKRIRGGTDGRDDRGCAIVSVTGNHEEIQMAHAYMTWRNANLTNDSDRVLRDNAEADHATRAYEVLRGRFSEMLDPRTLGMFARSWAIQGRSLDLKRVLDVCLESVSFPDVNTVASGTYALSQIDESDVVSGALLASRDRAVRRIFEDATALQSGRVRRDFLHKHSVLKNFNKIVYAKVVSCLVESSLDSISLLCETEQDVDMVRNTVIDMLDGVHAKGQYLLPKDVYARTVRTFSRGPSDVLRRTFVPLEHAVEDRRKSSIAFAGVCDDMASVCSEDVHEWKASCSNPSISTSEDRSPLLKWRAMSLLRFVRPAKETEISDVRRRGGKSHRNHLHRDRPRQRRPRKNRASP